jgi:hypothetical protein
MSITTERANEIANWALQTKAPGRAQSAADIRSLAAQRDAAVEALRVADAWFREQDDNDTHAEVVRAAIAAAGGGTLANGPHDHDHREAQEQG